MSSINSSGNSADRAIERMFQGKDAAFGEQEVRASSKSELGKKVTEFVSETLDELLEEHKDGNLFLRSTITVHPKVRFFFRDLQPLVEGSSLLPQEVGKILYVDSLADPRFGTFTDHKIPLELRNIHFPDRGGVWQVNDWTPEKIRKHSQEIVINGEKTIGEVDVDPNLKTCEIVADVRFGDFEAKEQKIRAQTRDDETLELTVALSKLDLNGVIQSDGTVRLNNGASFPIQELIGYDTENIWVDVEYEYDLEFEKE